MSLLGNSIYPSVFTYNSYLLTWPYRIAGNLLVIFEGENQKTMKTTKFIVLKNFLLYNIDTSPLWLLYVRIKSHVFHI